MDTAPEPTGLRPVPRRREAWLALRAVVGFALVAAPVWAVLSTGDAVAHQHVTLALLLGASALAGVVLLVLTVLAWRRRATRPDHRRPVLRAVASGVGLALLVVLAGAAAWLRPFPATPAALDALVSDDAVEVQEASGWYAFVPRDIDASTGLVYSPGARVDVRATAAVLRPLAEAGYVVVALKEPLGIALTSPGQSASAIAGFDDVEHWVVGGHSLGGVAASSFAAAHDDVVDGLLLHASYPLGDMADADLAVTSVWGSRDGLTTAEDVEASRADLPAGATFVEVPGGVHAFFADYGPQPGDGTPTVSRAEAQERIVAASLDALAAVAP